jgi:hypothetical protein
MGGGMREVSRSLAGGVDDQAGGAPPQASASSRIDAVSPDTPSQMKRKLELQEENTKTIARIVSSHKDSLYSNPDDDRCLICVRFACFLALTPPR